MDNEDKKYSEHYKYYYKKDIEKEGFYMLPKPLLTHKEFKSYSIASKVLYSVLFDRARLSLDNDWIDDKGRVYIYMSVEEAAELLGCSINSCSKYFKELDEETGIGLIKRKRDAFGGNFKIYVCRYDEKILWDIEHKCVFSDNNKQTINTNTPKAVVPAHSNNPKIVTMEQPNSICAGQHINPNFVTMEQESPIPPKIVTHTPKNCDSMSQNLGANNINNNNINNNKNSTCNINRVSPSPFPESNTNLQEPLGLNIDMTCNGIPTLQDVLDFSGRVGETQKRGKEFFDYQTKRNWKFNTGAIIRNWKKLFLDWNKSQQTYHTQLELSRQSTKRSSNQVTTDWFKTEEERQAWEEEMQYRTSHTNWQNKKQTA